jgi:ribosome-binding protein aMBF1 (putative translation factor)
VADNREQRTPPDEGKSLPKTAESRTLADVALANELIKNISIVAPSKKSPYGRNRVKNTETPAPLPLDTVAPQLDDETKTNGTNSNRVFRGKFCREELAEQFKAAREAKGLSQRAAAAAAGKRQNEFLRLEKAEFSPSSDKLESLAEALGYEIYFELRPINS